MAVERSCEEAVRDLLHAGADVKVDRTNEMREKNMWRCTNPWDRAMCLSQLIRANQHSKHAASVAAILSEAGVMSVCHLKTSTELGETAGDEGAGH